jgi:hypothetical protein
VPHHHEHERPSSPFLESNVNDLGGTCDAVTDMKGMVEFEASTGPHASRKIYWRQKAAAFRVAVGTEVGLAMDRQEVQPVPERAKRISWVVDIECCSQCRDRRGSGFIGCAFGFADPRLQLFYIQTG